MAINNEPTIQPRTVTGIFTNYIAKVLPLAFDESMSYYECLCALLKYINDTIVPDINNTNEGLGELQGFYEELQSYVNNYLTDENLQPLINNKLDEYVENGTMDQLINQEVFGTINNRLDNLDEDNLDNIVVVGDSYTALGTSTWAESVANQLHLTLYKHATSSMGYVHAIQDKTFIDNLSWGMAESLRLKTKYLICYGGLNDLNETPATVTQAVIDFCNQAKTLFPNARIIIVGPQSDIPSSNAKKLLDIINAIHEGAVNSGVGYADAHTWLYDTPYGYAYTYASDNTHPNTLGYKIIASKMLSLINGENSDKTSILAEAYTGLENVTTIRTNQNDNSTHINARITNVSMTNESFTPLLKVNVKNLGFCDTTSPLMILGYNATYGFYTKLIGFATITNDGRVVGVNITGADYNGAVQVIGDIQLTYNRQL